MSRSPGHPPPRPCSAAPCAATTASALARTGSLAAKHRHPWPAMAAAGIHGSGSGAGAPRRMRGPDAARHPAGRRTGSARFCRARAGCQSAGRRVDAQWGLGAPLPPPPRSLRQDAACLSTLPAARGQTWDAGCAADQTMAARPLRPCRLAKGAVKPRMRRRGPKGAAGEEAGEAAPSAQVADAVGPATAGAGPQPRGCEGVIRAPRTQNTALRHALADTLSEKDACRGQDRVQARHTPPPQGVGMGPQGSRGHRGGQPVCSAPRRRRQRRSRGGNGGPAAAGPMKASRRAAGIDPGRAGARARSEPQRRHIRHRRPRRSGPPPPPACSAPPPSGCAPGRRHVVCAVPTPPSSAPPALRAALAARCHAPTRAASRISRTCLTPAVTNLRLRGLDACRPAAPPPAAPH